LSSTGDSEGKKDYGNTLEVNGYNCREALRGMQTEDNKKR